MDEAGLRAELARVQERIERARERGGRPDEVRVIGVTKGHPPDIIALARAAGITRCGENRVSELEQKVEVHGRNAVEWHLIGHLQRNKVRKALPLFDLMHSVDSERLAREVSDEAVRAGRTAAVLIQVNVSGEETKGGFNALREHGPALEAIARVSALPGLEVRGLMTMAPFTEDEAILRDVFKRARSLFDAGRAIGGFRAESLSMGMSNDFEIAVEEGSTMVRLGTILFGERQT